MNTFYKSICGMTCLVVATFAIPQATDEIKIAQHCQNVSDMIYSAPQYNQTTFGIACNDDEEVKCSLANNIGPPIDFFQQNFIAQCITNKT